MIDQVTRYLRLRWVVLLLLSLLWATMGGAVALAEHGDFGSCALAAKTPLHVPGRVQSGKK